MRRGPLVKRDRDGIFFARPYLGLNKITGRPIRPYKRFPEARTEAEAERMAEKWLERQEAASMYGVSGRLAELLSSYIDLLEAHGAPANTVKTHRSTLRCYIAPNVGSMTVGEFTAARAQNLYNVILLQESRRGGTVSPSTLAKVHWLLSGAFKHFVSHGVADANPMPWVDHPSTETKEARAYDEREFARLSAHLAEAMRAEAPSPEAARARMVAFAAYTALWHGTRGGETCALAADSDVQLWRSNLHVHSTMVESGGEVRRQEKTKGKRSRNLAIWTAPAEAFERHLAWAAAEVPRAPGVPRMAVSMEDGSFMRPSDLSRWYNALIRDRLGLPGDTHFHTLRHTHATWMILNGADIVTVSERLGHYKESLTLELYGHLMPGRDAAAVAAFAEFAERACGTTGGEK